MKNPVAFGQNRKQEISRLLDIANLALSPSLTKEIEKTLKTAMKSDNVMIRYWSMMTCAAMGEKAKSLQEPAQVLLNDDQEIVRIRAAEFLGVIHATNPQNTLINVINTTQNPIIATEALNSVVLFRDFYADRYPVKRQDFEPITSGADMDDRLNYINGIPYPQKPNSKPQKNKQKN
jgi:hypothetical protein